MKQLNMDILNITMKIHQDYPELSKYINEMPVKGFNTAKEVSVQNLDDYRNSLLMMLKKYAITHIGKEKHDKLLTSFFFPEYLYPASEDIYAQGIQERDIDPDDPTTVKKDVSVYSEEKWNDLDVPGSELDDQQENIGSEDEENNYYSIGGDAHNDLDENNV